MRCVAIRSRASLPLRIIVPSRSLRDHLAATFVRDVSPSLAGVSIQTLRAFALTVIEAAGRTAPRGAATLRDLGSPRGEARPAPRVGARRTDAWAARSGDDAGRLFDAGFTTELVYPLLESLEEERAQSGRRTVEV